MPKNNRKVRKSRYKDREPLDRYARNIFGGLSSVEVEYLQSLRRAGFSYRKIKKITFLGLGTIWKYTHMITQESVISTHESIEDSLVRLGFLAPRPPTPVSPPPPVTQTQTIFEGTLYVPADRPQGFRLTTPANSRSTIISVTAQGSSPFFIQLISPPQTLSFPLGFRHPNPLYCSQLVTKIIREFGLPEVGVWYLNFCKGSLSTDNAINATIRMTTTSVPGP